MRRHGLVAALLASAALGSGAAEGRASFAARDGLAPAVSAPASAAKRSGTVTLRHRATRFSIRAPRGFRLRFSKGVYVLSRGARRMSFSRALTGTAPGAFGDALLQQLGGSVVSRRASANRFTAQIDRGADREGVVVARDGKVLEVTTATSRRSQPLALSTVRRVGSSARGGVALRPPAAQGSAPDIPLQPYRAPDGGATAMVPAEPGWDIQSGNGTIQGSSSKGAFLFGLSINIFLPETAPPGTPAGILVSPYLPAAEALVQIFPRLSPAVSDIRVRSVLFDSPLPTFSSSAMLLFDYKLDGRPWTGAATIATDSPDRYSNYVWNLYYSGVGVPAGSDGSVGVALLKAWKSWDPSGAIAQRTARAKELISETNAIWQQTLEFRSRTADRQARDVGCLLLGYYVIEDNSRKYDLPPLPCGRQYVPGD
jgi:hypothetical protein